MFLETALLVSDAGTASLSCSGSFVAAVLAVRLVRSEGSDELVTKLDESASWQRFGEDVGELLVGRNPLQGYEFGVHLLANKVVLDGNVFAVAVRTVVVRQSDGTLVVAQDQLDRWRGRVWTHPGDESDLDQ